jgi:hypothetical protein
MHVIGHQDVRMDATRVGERRFLKAAQVASIVRLVEEAGLSIIAALYDMLGDVGELDAR